MIILIAICLPLVCFVVGFTLAGIAFQRVPEGARRRPIDPMTIMMAVMAVLGSLMLVDTPIFTPVWTQYLVFVALPAAIGVVLARVLSRR